MFRSPTFFSVLLVAGLTHAQPAAQPGGVEAAKRLFKEAVALEARSDWTNAERKLREALVVKDTPGLRYHLAFCQAQQGKLLEAQADYDRAQALIDGGMPAPDVQQLLTEARADVVRRISDLTLQVPARVPSFQVFIDGQQVQLDRGQPLRINPGSHQLELRAEGHRPFTTKVEMGEGDHRTLAIDPVPVAPPASAPIAAAPRPLAPLPPVAPPKRSAKPVVLIAEGALVAVGLGIGIWGLALRSSAADRRDSATAELDACRTATPTQPVNCRPRTRSPSRARIDAKRSRISRAPPRWPTSASSPPASVRPQRSARSCSGRRAQTARAGPRLAPRSDRAPFTAVSAAISEFRRNRRRPRPTP